LFEKVDIYLANR